MSISSAEKAVVAALAESGDAMLELLHRLVNIDSGSYDKAGVDAVQSVLREHLAANGIAADIHPDQTYGNCMTASVKAADGSDARPVLLMGHCDTVFAK